MPVFKVDGHYIECDTEAQAKETWSHINLKRGTDKFIYLKASEESRSASNIIDIPPEGLEIWTKSGTSVKYVGKITNNAGDKLLSAAIDSIKVSEADAKKLAVQTKKAKIASRHANDEAVINTFLETVPKIAQPLFDDVCASIEATTDAHLLQVIWAVREGGADPKPENWMPILTWFKDAVIAKEVELPLAERRTFFSLRKAFAAAIVRMVKEDVRHGSTMKMVLDEGERDDDFWSRYAKEQAGS